MDAQASAIPIRISVNTKINICKFKTFRNILRLQQTENNNNSLKKKKM